MIPEIGHLALIPALALAQGRFVFVALAFACLAQAFLSNDFSVLYVAQHSNSQLPADYRFAATWGGHEGSLLLWTFILTIWAVAVTQLCKQLPEEMLARVSALLSESTGKAQS